MTYITGDSNGCPVMYCLLVRNVDSSSIFAVLNNKASLHTTLSQSEQITLTHRYDFEQIVVVVTLT